MARKWSFIGEWCALPAAWVALVAIVVLGATLGGIQLIFALVMLVASPLLRRGFLAVVRHIYPTRVGRVHVWFMLVVRRYWLRGRRHAVPIRIDLPSAAAAASSTMSSSSSSSSSSSRGETKSEDGTEEEGRTRASVHVVAGLVDNYTYVVVERASSDARKSGGRMRPLRCCIVDPGDAEATIEALQYIREQHYGDGGSSRRGPTVDVVSGSEMSSDQRGTRATSKDEDEIGPLVVTCVMVTHKHWDHQAGVLAVVRSERETTRRAHSSFPTEFPVAGIEVVAGEHERGVAGCTRRVSGGERVAVGRLLFEVLPSPCHTRGHVMFGLVAAEPRTAEGVEGVDALFTGDTLFCGGCGAPFEGSPRDMAANFRSIYHRCGDATLLFPGHEYSEPLLLEYFGGSQQTPWSPRQYATLCHALQRARDARSHHRPTVPVVLGTELMYNAHFSSLHNAATTLCDAWRVFAHAVNARAASEEAIAALRQSLPGNPETQHHKLALVSFIESSFRAQTASSAGAATGAPTRRGGLAALRHTRSEHSLLTGAPPAGDLDCVDDYHDAGVDDAEVAAPLARAIELAPRPSAAKGLDKLARAIGPVRRGSRRRSTSLSYAVRHRVKVLRAWRPGDRVTVRVSSIDFECRVPEGVRPGDDFYLRIPRDRLPRLLCYAPPDLADPMATVWRRDLERLHSLLAANDEQTLDRARTLSRAVLVSPLRDVRDYDDPNIPPPDARARTLLPRASYRGAPDEIAAQLSAEARDDVPVATSVWRDPPPRAPPATIIYGIDADVDRALSARRRAPDSYARLAARRETSSTKAGGGGGGEPYRKHDWRVDLRPANDVFDALCLLSAAADLTPGSVDPEPLYFDEEGDSFDSKRPTITKTELRRALATLGPRPLGHAQVDELIDLADLAECFTSDTALDIQKLATLLGSDGATDSMSVDRPRPCCCCCCRPPPPEKLEPLDDEIEAQHLEHQRQDIDA
ncbi:hypothetical protein CTAYLR_003650 [Chrysophaeum taylorii]|uniref:Metallo-beta-lactamase domain-containing protein n=1 Tax=Chrysophaeum taylorii TaxID=2483200 RepID=A0AAD7XHZ6_9STRA|nr:hypothetical protein CTAYLR_003650 [Chrysophaeum taylorii]